MLAEPEPTAPLAVLWCPGCTLSQLSVVVDPDVLYTGYRFRAGASDAWRAHVADLASTSGPTGRILDIAANDGALLRAFRTQGWDILGVDPAPASDDMPLIAASWNHDTARLARDLAGPFDIVTATNVLGHVDNPVDFLAACQDVLVDDGEVIVEAPYVGALLKGNQFDTVYHEHLSYWTVTAMREAARRADFYVSQLEWLPDIHGGSYRYRLRQGAIRRPTTWIERVPDLDRYATYDTFGQRIGSLLENAEALLGGILDYQAITGYGAAAKGAVTLNAMPSVAKRITRVIDDTLAKQGLYMPGVAAIVNAPDDVYWPDLALLWLLSWNNADTLKEKAYKRGFRGDFFTMLPKPKVFR